MSRAEQVFQKYYLLLKKKKESKKRERENSTGCKMEFVKIWKANNSHLGFA